MLYMLSFTWLTLIQVKDFLFLFSFLYFFFVKVVIRINMLAKSTTTWLSIVKVYSKADAISSLLVNHYNESG